MTAGLANTERDFRTGFHDALTLKTEKDLRWPEGSSGRAGISAGAVTGAGAMFGFFFSKESSAPLALGPG